MVRLLSMDGILLSFLLGQFYIIGRPTGVRCQMIGYSKQFEILKNVEKRAAHTPSSKEEICYDANNKDHLRLWTNRAPGAVGNNPCKDIPFLVVFYPKKSAPRTNVGIVLIPGGGYSKISNPKKQIPIAQHFANTLGITTFVLYYRVVKKDGTYRYPVPMWDGQRALRYVRSNAAKFHINPNHLGVFGLSAGGHLASIITLHADQNFDLPKQDNSDKINARPNFLGLGYPVISVGPEKFAKSQARKNLLHGYTGTKHSKLQDFLSGHKHVGRHTPPTFIFTSKDDKVINAQNSILFIDALEKAHIPHEAHIFKHGRHGAGLAQDEPEERVWPEHFRKWLIKRKLISG